ncbi:MAG: sigma-70 family RNA polymerase sigma factor [Gemmatimonadales bacterium]|nr:MAG: sigma-70 family RNA polymerase sigma factor [Gemmatimonadales bacterium]
MAEVLGLSEANVGVRLHRVRKRLKNELTGDDQ